MKHLRVYLMVPPTIHRKPVKRTGEADHNTRERGGGCCRQHFSSHDSERVIPTMIAGAGESLLKFLENGEEERGGGMKRFVMVVETW